MIFRLSLIMAAQALTKGASIAVVDGCNRSDVHLIARYARERQIDPAVLLNRIFISRGFTCYQMEAAITSRLPVFLKQLRSKMARSTMPATTQAWAPKPPTALIFGLLDTFYDEQAPLREVQQALRRVIASLQTLKAQGISILLTSMEWNVLPKERNQLLTTLKSGMDRVYRLTIHQDGKPHLLLEQQSQQYLLNRGLHYGTNRTNVYAHH